MAMGGRVPGAVRAGEGGHGRPVVLLILGEEGLSEAAGRGDEAAAKIRDATLDPSLRFPFSLWVSAALLKIGSAFAAGVRGGRGMARGGRLDRAGGRRRMGRGVPYRRLPAGERGDPPGLSRPTTSSAGGRPRCCLRASALPAAAAEAAGRFFFPGRFSPEALMDIRFGSEEGILTVIEEGAEHGTIDPSEVRMIEGIIRYGDRTVSEEMTPRSRVVFRARERRFRGVPDRGGDVVLPLSRPRGERGRRWSGSCRPAPCSSRGRACPGSGSLRSRSTFPNR